MIINQFLQIMVISSLECSHVIVLCQFGFLIKVHTLWLQIFFSYHKNLLSKKLFTFKGKLLKKIVKIISCHHKLRFSNLPFSVSLNTCTCHDTLLENFMLCQSYHDVCDVLVYEYIIDMCVIWSLVSPTNCLSSSICFCSFF